MSPVWWGLIGAAAFGTGDFIARIAGRGIGPQSTTLGMLIAGAATFWLWILVADLPLVLSAEGLALVVPAGLVVMAASLLFFVALTRGPVSIVAPIGAAFPVWVVVLGLALGIVPQLEQFAAMGVVMAGVVIVTRFSDPKGEDVQGGGGIWPTVFMTLAVTMMFAAVIYIARDASVILGEVQATAWMRLVSLAAMAAFVLAMRRSSFRIAPRWWPAVLAIGFLDTVAFLALLFGARGTGAPLAAVAMSSYTVITVVLARLFLKENVPPRQWIGIAVVVAGVAILAYHG